MALGLLKRLLKLSEAGLEAALEKFEDPIKMSEQAVNDLRVDLQQSTVNLAEVKAIYIRLDQKSKDQGSKADEYEHKATLLLQKAQRGGMDMAEAERLARESLAHGEQARKCAVETEQQAAVQKQLVDKLQANVDDLKTQIAEYERDLGTLKARAKSADATERINRRLFSVDSKSPAAAMERAKEKVAMTEAAGDALGAINTSKSFDDEIDAALGNEDEDAALNSLKEKLGMKDGAGKEATEA